MLTNEQANERNARGQESMYIVALGLYLVSAACWLTGNWVLALATGVLATMTASSKP